MNAMDRSDLIREYGSHSDEDGSGSRLDLVDSQEQRGTRAMMLYGSLVGLIAAIGLTAYEAGMKDWLSSVLK